jgi:hypothetical protein
VERQTTRITSPGAGCVTVFFAVILLTIGGTFFGIGAFQSTSIWSALFGSVIGIVLGVPGLLLLLLTLVLIFGRRETTWDRVAGTMRQSDSWLGICFGVSEAKVETELVLELPTPPLLHYPASLSGLSIVWPDEPALRVRAARIITLVLLHWAAEGILSFKPARFEYRLLGRYPVNKRLWGEKVLVELIKPGHNSAGALEQKLLGTLNGWRERDKYHELPLGPDLVELASGCFVNSVASPEQTLLGWSEADALERGLGEKVPLFLGLKKFRLKENLPPGLTEEAAYLAGLYESLQQTHSKLVEQFETDITKGLASKKSSD